jgi:coniferyl-aldehyde dehydrogenase
MSGAPDARQLLEAQQAAFRAEAGADAPATGPEPAAGPDARVRRDRLKRAIALLVDHQVDICEALAHDFGRRPATLTRFVDILPAISSLKYARAHLSRWMRPRRQRIGLPIWAPGVRAEIVPQPLGVVGLISPWNFPITLTFGPLAGILAAGNRCLIKPSELAPAVSALMAACVARYFDPTEVAVVTGGADVAEAFSGLPFDHLMFTGSTSIGRRVMAAAAEHLVPVTLELGGKCPVLIGRSAPLRRTVDRILLGKLTNGGQMCIAPDYVLLPEDMLETFVRAVTAWVERAYPGGVSNPDCTHLVSEMHAERMRSLLADAAAKGARVVRLGTGSDGAGANGRYIAPALILDATDDMRVMQEEIFGPILPVRTYREIAAAVAQVNARPKALALYYFGEDRGEMQWVLAHTVSGGATVNDIAVHFLAEEMPFGGVGESGMGAYHGEHGFRRFSHARTVFRQTPLDVHGLVGLRPPYGRRAERILKWLIRP